MVCKQNKRPFEEDELACQVSYKHSREMEYGCHYSSFFDIYSCHDFGGKVQSSGGEERVLKVNRETGNLGSTFQVLTGSTSHISSWENVDNRWESASYPLLSDANVAHDPFGKKPQAADLYSSFLDCSPKAVPIGPDHQADISQCIPQMLFEYSSRKAIPIGPDHQADIPMYVPQMCAGFPTEDDKKMMGTCVLPVSSPILSSIHDEIGKGRVDCRCPDEGSVSCVRRHVVEAREKIRAEVGEDKFLHLGFADMGEEVSSKWSKEEEQLFKEVVYANPVSLGRNFWVYLSVLFPSKTSKDMVSYYFNVFMLRTRADQNRLDPLHVDSDNDEWQGSDDDDDDDDDESGSIGDDEDSAVESPVDQSDLYCSLIRCYKDGDGIEVDNFEDSEQGNAEGDNNTEIFQFGRSVSFGGCSPCSAAQLEYTNRDALVSDDPDVQDDSCTSYESQLNGTLSFCPTAMDAIQEPCFDGDYKNTMRTGCSDGRSEVAFSSGYALEPCDSKGWNGGYFSVPGKEVDFLPTCHVIEEVIGEESSKEKQ